MPFEPKSKLLKGSYLGDYIGVDKADTGSLEYSSSECLD